jgi:hypothetical protein
VDFPFSELFEKCVCVWPKLRSNDSNILVIRHQLSNEIYSTIWRGQNPPPPSWPSTINHSKQFSLLTMWSLKRSTPTRQEPPNDNKDVEAISRHTPCGTHVWQVADAITVECWSVGPNYSTGWNWYLVHLKIYFLCKDIYFLYYIPSIYLVLIGVASIEVVLCQLALVFIGLHGEMATFRKQPIFYYM